MSSPILARVAIRAAARNAFQAQTRRQFSIVSSLRQFARSFEHAPFERLPTTTSSAAADWGRQVQRIGKQGVIYFPAMCMMLGWPYAAATMLDGHV
ncbi:hypothetical protein QBC42DRAFT_265761 [Cladorrhinum samala]|uniref:Uncharacterized protein n=1 Tax=Cladorrhinum samala TaxID=585594 RepID=A0AAV9HRN7_9PEZI|nr:hypothetical protein QBC42DRAFT_265761 [Cladorrhinum samala]